MKKLFFLTALLCASLMGFAQERIYDINFALASNGSSATATSENGDNTAIVAIDGNTGTRWESVQKPEKDKEENPIPDNIAWNNAQEWILNMGQQRIFNTINILWEGAYAKKYELFYSNNGETWTSFYEEDNLTKSGWQLIEIGEEITAQYVKFQGIERATQYGYSFFEFEVFLPSVSVVTTINISTASQYGQANGSGIALTSQAKDQNGVEMEADVDWEITPSDAGSVVNGKYIPSKVGSASIVATYGEVHSNAVTIFGYEGSNLAYSTNIDDSKIINQSDFTPNGTNAFFAIDGKDETVYQGSPNGESGEDDDESRTYDAWFIVDLGAFYSLDLVVVYFEGACSQDYHIDFSEDNSNWDLGYNYVGAKGINGRKDILTSQLTDNTKVRYVRFWSTKAATQWGTKVREFEVYGRPWSAPTAIENTGEEVKAVKMIENGQLVIIKNGVKYNVAGQQVK